MGPLIHFFMYPDIHLSFCVSVCLSYLSIYLCENTSISLFIYPSCRSAIQPTYYLYITNLHLMFQPLHTWRYIMCYVHLSNSELKSSRGNTEYLKGKNTFCNVEKHGELRTACLRWPTKANILQWLIAVQRGESAAS